MIKKISKELTKRSIYHKIEENFILTRKSKTKIPLVNKEIFYLLGVISGDGSLVKTKRKRGVIIIYLEFIQEKKNTFFI